MASPGRAVRLRIPSYLAIEGASATDTGKDLIYILQAERIQRDITDGGRVLSFAGRNNVTWAFSILRYAITINGTFEENLQEHTIHPLLTAVEHEPDWIDMEEATITWNNQAKPNGADAITPSLELNYGTQGDAFRIYKGVIKELEMVREEGKTEVAFKLVFEVVWSDTNPTLREWA